MSLFGNQKGYILLCTSLYTAFLDDIKPFGYKIGIQFDNRVFSCRTKL